MQIARVPLCLFRACTLTHNTVVPDFPHHLRFLPAASSSLSLSSSRRAPPSNAKDLVHTTARGVGIRDLFLRKARRDGTIISVDYAIIVRPGGSGGHLTPLTRPRGGFSEPTPEGLRGTSSSPRALRNRTDHRAPHLSPPHFPIRDSRRNVPPFPTRAHTEATRVFEGDSSKGVFFGAIRAVTSRRSRHYYAYLIRDIISARGFLSSGTQVYPI